jgi:predicted RNase H-like HicB family nuclease
MLTYRAAYRRELGAFCAVVLDFPEASAMGSSVDEVRRNLHSALRYAAARRLQRGDFLPTPDPTLAAPDAYLLEEIRVLPAGDGGVQVVAL